MSDQLELNLFGLTRSQFDRLCEYADRAAGKSPDQLLSDAHRHLEQTKVAHATNRMINVKLATAIVEVIEKVVAEWGSLPGAAKNWLAGATHFRASSLHAPVT